MRFPTMVRSALLFGIVSSCSAAAQEMTPFLSTETLKQNLNSTDTAKLMSAVSYVGGIADYLMAKKQICPPPGATIVKAAMLVKGDLNLDSNKYPHLSAVVPTEFALKMGWPCR